MEPSAEGTVRGMVRAAGCLDEPVRAQGLATHAGDRLDHGLCWMERDFPAVSLMPHGWSRDTNTATGLSPMPAGSAPGDPSPAHQRLGPI